MGSDFACQKTVSVFQNLFILAMPSSSKSVGQILSKRKSYDLIFKLETVKHAEKKGKLLGWCKKSKLPAEVFKTRLGHYNMLALMPDFSA
jgi:hypothetical protein